MPLTTTQNDALKDLTLLGAKNNDTEITAPLSIDAPGALTEMGNSIAFVSAYKELCRFSFDGKRWYVWDNGQRWKPKL